MREAYGYRNRLLCPPVRWYKPMALCYAVLASSAHGLEWLPIGYR